MIFSLSSKVAILFMVVVQVAYAEYVPLRKEYKEEPGCPDNYKALFDKCKEQTTTNVHECTWPSQLKCEADLKSRNIYDMTPCSICYLNIAHYWYVKCFNDGDCARTSAHRLAAGPL